MIDRILSLFDTAEDEIEETIRNLDHDRGIVEVTDPEGSIRVFRLAKPVREGDNVWLLDRGKELRRFDWRSVNFYTFVGCQIEEETPLWTAPDERKEEWASNKRDEITRDLYSNRMTTVRHLDGTYLFHRWTPSFVSPRSDGTLGDCDCRALYLFPEHFDHRILPVGDLSHFNQWKPADIPRVDGKEGGADVENIERVRKGGRS